MTIVRPVLDELCAHAAQERPRECCGMLIGTATSVVASAPARNLAEGNTRFLLDPQDHIAAIRRARAASLDVVGFYHSHPRSRAYPSETDIAECGYAGVVHLILGVNEGADEVRAFTIDGAQVIEMPLQIVAGQPVDW